MVGIDRLDQIVELRLQRNVADVLIERAAIIADICHQHGWAYVSETTACSGTQATDLRKYGVEVETAKCCKGTPLEKEEKHSHAAQWRWLLALAKMETHSSPALRDDSLQG